MASVLPGVVVYLTAAWLLLVVQHANSFTALVTAPSGSRWSRSYTTRCYQRGPASVSSQQRCGMSSRQPRLQMSLNPNSDFMTDFRGKIKESDFQEAYQMLRRNPIANLTMEDGSVLLNNIEKLVPVDPDPEAQQQQMTEVCSFLYKRLERQHVLRGFGCVGNEYPEPTTEISPTQLESITGLNYSSLTPQQQRTTYWRLGGLVVFAAEYALGSAAGVDPLLTIIPASCALFLTDQFVWKGAGFESIYQTLFPEYKRKVARHEAGHFLVAYLLGLPVRGCVTDAWEARKYPEIRGQAGTIFYDNKLNDEVVQQKVTRSSLDRLAVVIMAGIAAEALEYGQTEGGVTDEQALVSFLTSLQPPWNLLRIQSKARWAAVQAVLLIKEHRAAYEALVEALEQKRGVGDIVRAIEQNLPAVLPATQRLQARTENERQRDMSVLMRYVQRMTWRVGGISEEPPKEDSDSSISEEGFVLSSASSVSSAVLPAIGERAKSASPAPLSSTTAAIDIKGDSDSDADTVVREFADKMKRLEEEVRNGRVGVAEQGAWLNGLRSLEDSANQAGGEKPESSSLGMPVVDLPPPIEGFEQRVEAMLQEQEKQVGQQVPVQQEPEQASSVMGMEFATAVSDKRQSSLALHEQGPSASSNTDHSLSQKSRDPTIAEMLISRRGYQMKRLENLESGIRTKLRKVENRLTEMEKSKTEPKSVGAGRY